MSTNQALWRATTSLKRSLTNRSSIRYVSASSARPATLPSSPNRSLISPTTFRRLPIPAAQCLGKSQNRFQSSNISPAPEFYTEEDPGRTGLYDLHLEHGAKMVPFAGYSMPVQYSDLSVGESHIWTREKASLFDVGHMVQYHIEGPKAEAFLESITPAGLKDMKPGQSTLSTILHPKTGGIVDDCIITRLEEGPKHLFYLVSNAGCREKDYEFLTASLERWNTSGNPAVHIRHLQADGEPYGLVALQGPLAAEVLAASLAETCKIDVGAWYFGTMKYITLGLPSGESLPVVASRAGYTGEDGFELSIHPSQTVAVTKHLLEVGGKDKLRFAGLGARDSLRLEAGMCLYGHDLNDDITPVEAGLSWIIPKSRREGDAAGFNGAETILPQLTPVSKGGKGVSRRRVGFIIEGAPAREGAAIVDANDRVIGNITSGCPSPSMKKNIAMGYIRDGMHKSGTEVQVVVRGKKRKALVSKMPFLPSKYFKPV